MSTNDFIIENGVLIKYTGSKENVVIPDGVTNIGQRAFYNCKVVVNLTISKSVTKIDDEAFSYCSNLKNIDFGEVQEIGFSAFKECVELVNISFPDCLRKINNLAFARCIKLENIELPSSLELFVCSPFYYCHNLKCVVFKGQKCKVHKGSFVGCSSLETVVLPPKSVLDIGAFDDVCFDKNGLANALPQLWNNLPDDDLCYYLSIYTECFGYEALAKILLTRLKHRRKIYTYFEKFITKQNGGTLARFVLENLPLKADKSTCIRVAYILVLFAEKVVPRRLIEIYEWLQTHNEKALQIIKEKAILLEIIGVENL